MNGKVIPHTPLAVDFWQVRKCAHVRLFFLTHMHSDHTSGLTSTWSNRPIYCSPITAKLLKLKLQVDDKWIHPLELSTPHQLPLDDVGKEKMTVTLIDADHCPGAVMYLFEGYFGNILYTGDFRYNPSMLRESCLCTHITIDVLYLDNTNCDPTRTLPSRKQATQQVKEIIRCHPGYRVVIGLYSLGKESLLVDLALEFKTWVEVRPERLETLLALDLPNVFTTETDVGRIRVVNQDEIRPANLFQWNREEPTLAILPTSRPMVSCHPCVHVVPYSDHSSYQELEDFLLALRPISVLPIVGDALPSFSAFTPRKKRHKTVVPDSVQHYMAAPLQQGGGGAAAQDGSLCSTLPKRAPLQARRGVVFDSPAKPPSSALQHHKTAASDENPDADPQAEPCPSLEEEVDSMLNGSSCILLDIEQGSIIDVDSEASAQLAETCGEASTQLAKENSEVSIRLNDDAQSETQQSSIISDVSMQLADAQSEIGTRLADVSTVAKFRLDNDKSVAGFRLDSEKSEKSLQAATETSELNQPLAENETEPTVRDFNEEVEEGGSESGLPLAKDGSQCCDPPGSRLTPIARDGQPAPPHGTTTVVEENSPNTPGSGTSSLECIDLHDNTCVATMAVTPQHPCHDPSQQPCQSRSESQLSTEDMEQEEQRLLGNLDFPEEELSHGSEVLEGLGQVYSLRPLNRAPKRAADAFDTAIKRFKAALV